MIGDKSKVRVEPKKTTSTTAADIAATAARIDISPEKLRALASSIDVGGAGLRSVNARMKSVLREAANILATPKPEAPVAREPTWTTSGKPLTKTLVKALLDDAVTHKLYNNVRANMRGESIVATKVHGRDDGKFEVTLQARGLTNDGKGMRFEGGRFDDGTRVVDRGSVTVVVDGRGTFASGTVNGK